MISSFFYPGVWWNNRTVSLDAVDVVKYKEYVFWNEESSSYKQILPKNATNAVYFYSSSMLREQVRYMHIKNIYCSPGRGIATADAQVRIWPDPIKIIEEIPTNVSYEHIIFLYSEWGNVFGHFLQDCLSQLTWFPKRLIDKSMIIISFDINQSMPYLKVFGIPKEKVIYYQKSWFYAYNLYMALPTEAVNSMNVYSFKKVVKKLRKRFKVDSIKAAKYVVTNRKRRMSRCIKNFSKLKAALKAALPNYQWEMIKPINDNLGITARTIATFKCWVAPSGSLFMNMLFMNLHGKSGVVFVGSELADYPNFGLANILGIWAITWTNQFPHHQKGGGEVDIFYGVRCIARICYALSTGKWPLEWKEDMIPAFDFQDMRKQMNENVSKLVEIKVCNGSYVYLNESSLIYI